MTEKILLDSTIFWAFAGLSVLAALGVVFHRSIIYSALMLIIVFLSIAGIFVLNNADFLAIAQTVVYAVGLTIILIFGVMFTGDRSFQDGTVSRGHYVLFGIITVLTLGVLLRGSIFPYETTKTPEYLVTVLQNQGSTALLGQALFSRFVLPFELASILLLVAMIGAIVIAKKRFPAEDELLGKTRYDINTTSVLNPEAEQEFDDQFKRLVEESKPRKMRNAGADDISDEEGESSEMVGAK